MQNPRILEANGKVIKFLQDIYEEEQQKIDELQSKFIIRYAYLPVRLSNGRFIWFKYYCARYKAEPIRYIEYTISGKGGFKITNPYKHYIDKDYVLDYTKPIEKITIDEYVLKTIK